MIWGLQTDADSELVWTSACAFTLDSTPAEQNSCHTYTSFYPQTSNIGCST